MERRKRQGGRERGREEADLVSHVMGIAVSKPNSPQEVRVLQIQSPHLCS